MQIQIVKRGSNAVFSLVNMRARVLRVGVKAETGGCDVKNRVRSSHATDKVVHELLTPLFVFFGLLFGALRLGGGLWKLVGEADGHCAYGHLLQCKTGKDSEEDAVEGREGRRDLVAPGDGN